MLAAELQDKISPAQPPSVRQEDVLTSHVFSLFRYLDDLRIPARLLRAALNIDQSPLAIEDLTAAEAHFWPTWQVGTGTRRRELDVLLILREAAGTSVAVGVENKYRSGPSDVQADEAGAEDDAPVFTGKQLVDEVIGLRVGEWIPAPCAAALASSTRRILLYVTRHYEMPVGEIQEALDVFAASPQGRTEAPTALRQGLFWLGWHTVHAILTEESLAGYPGYPPGHRRLLEDVRGMLQHRNLHDFHPYEDLAEVEAYTPLFPI